MKKIVLIVLLIVINKVTQAQSLEILDTNPYVENVIKKKFMSLQQSTVKNTCIGVDFIEESNIEIMFANKSKYQLMYWRYSDLDFKKGRHENSNTVIAFSNFKNDILKSKEILVTIKIIKYFIE